MYVESCVIAKPRSTNNYCYDPKKCGEDSFFNYKIGEKSLAIGIADGVGSWKDNKIDPAIFSRTLMENCHQIYNNCYYNNQIIDISQIVSQSFDKLLENNPPIYGSSTVCLLNFEYSENNVVAKTLQLGDSGYIIIRRNKIIYEFNPQRYPITYRENQAPF